MDGCTACSWIGTGNIPAPISPRERDAGRGAEGQEAPHRRQALPGPARLVGARHRLRLGRHGADPRAGLWRHGDRHHPVRRNNWHEAQARAEAEGLADRVSFQLLDYRAVDRRFDRIVSVGMFEHVGVVHYRAFFDTVARCLKPDGVALLHSIGQWDGPGSTIPGSAEYIFPGAYCPALSEVMPAIERSGLLTTDIEVLRLHYAETLRHWRRRFAANRDTIASLYDERFCRMFEFYLSSCELGFRVRQPGGLPDPARAPADRRAADPRLYYRFRSR